MKARYWCIIAGILSLAMVATAFILVFPPFSVVSKYNPELKITRFYRVNNWWGTYTILDYVETRTTDKAEKGEAAGVFRNAPVIPDSTKDRGVEVSSPFPDDRSGSDKDISVSDMTDPFATGQSSGGK